MAQDNGKQNIGQALPTFALISYRAVFPMFHNATHPVGWHCRLRRYCPPMNHGLWVLPPSFLRNLLVPGDFVSCHRKWMVSLWAAELIQLLGPGLGDFFSKNRVNISFKLGKYLPARNYGAKRDPRCIMFRYTVLVFRYQVSAHNNVFCPLSKFSVSLDFDHSACDQKAQLKHVSESGCNKN
jgi:hypothetical protein